jgi:hypothetical protein
MRPSWREAKRSNRLAALLLFERNVFLISFGTELRKREGTVPVSIEWSISCCRVIRFFLFVGLASLVSAAVDGVVEVGVEEAAGVGAGVAAGADEAAGAGAAATGVVGAGVGVVAAGAGVAGAAAAGGAAASVPAAGAVWANARPTEKVATTIAAKAAAIRKYSFIRRSDGTSPAILESLAAGFRNGR